jgi:hypothetical protein
MQMNNMTMLSQNFVGNAESVLQKISLFLNEIKIKNTEKKDFHLVHALVFSKEMSESEVMKVSHDLGDLYRTRGFDVLGGDTSTGSELSIFISTIVY